MNKFEKPSVFFGALLYPVYALPWIIKYMLKNEYFGYILFSWLMAVMAYLMVPYDTMDIARHYEAFDIISSMSFEELSNFDRIWDLALYVYMWIVHQLGLSKEFVPFSFAFATYMLYFISFKKIVKQPNYLRYSLFIILSLFLVINQIRFIGDVSGLRNMLGFAVFFYGLINYYFLNRKTSFYFISILAIFIHMSVIPLLLLVLVSKYINLTSFSRILIFLSLMLLILGLNSTIFYSIIHILEPFLRSHNLYFHAYMDPDGAWGSGFYADKNMKTIILEKVLKPLPFYLSSLYFIFSKNILNKKLYNYLVWLYMFIILVSVSRTMLDRYSWFFVMMFIYLFIYELEYKRFTKFKKFFVSILIIAQLLFDGAGIIKYRDTISLSWKEMFYKPVPILFLKHIEPKDYIHRESL